MDEAKRAPAPLTAEQLLDRGDYRGAIEAAMDEYGAAVFAFCLYNLKQRETAEDVLQNTFLQAHRDIAKFERRTSLKSWLMSIAAHRIYDAIDARKRHGSRVVDDDDDEAVDRAVDHSPGPGERLAGARLSQALVTCLEGLSDIVRSSVLMRFYAQLSYEEMAAATKAKSDTLNARVARALPVLRECLEAKGWNHA